MLLLPASIEGQRRTTGMPGGHSSSCGPLQPGAETVAYEPGAERPALAVMQGGHIDRQALSAHLEVGVYSGIGIL